VLAFFEVKTQIERWFWHEFYYCFTQNEGVNFLKSKALHAKTLEFAIFLKFCFDREDYLGQIAFEI